MNPLSSILDEKNMNIKKILDDEIFDENDKDKILDSIKSDSVILKLGNKLCTLQVIDDTESMGDIIKYEYYEKFLKVIDKIKLENVKKIEKYEQLINGFINDLQDKKNELDELLNLNKNVYTIPKQYEKYNISVYKDHENNNLTWYRLVEYSPKFVDMQRINVKTINKLKRDIYVKIVTSGKDIISISTVNIKDLSIFKHYHQLHSGRDCWGNWKYPTTWETVDDIIKISEIAVAVLENINTMSIALRNPKGLLRLDTVRRNLDLTYNATNANVELNNNEFVWENE